MASQNIDCLLEPFKLRNLELRNRIVMPPMTRCFSPDGIPTQEVVRYYAKRAAHGVGLIVTEGVAIPFRGCIHDEAVPSMFGAAMPVWKQVVDAVHAEGAAIMPQLWHVGLNLKPQLEGLFDGNSQLRADQIGPSGLADGIGNPPRPLGRPMTDRDIEQVIEAFAESAFCAYEAGFDGVQLHGAHGYLIDQFLWASTNVRKDQYGGDAANRSRFASDIVRAIRRRTAPDFPIVFRFSQWKLSDYEAELAATPAQLEAVLSPLVDAGVDMFDASQRRYWEPAFEGSHLNLAGWAKKLTGVPSSTVGSVSLDNDAIRTLLGESAQSTGIERLIERLQSGEFDLVGVGRSLIANPDWLDIVRAGRIETLKPYSPQLLHSLD